MTQLTARPSLEGPVDVMLNRTGDGAFATDAHGTITGWNKAAERMLGYTAREARGRPCCEIFGGYDAHGNRLCYAGCHIMTLVRRAEPVCAFEMRTRTKTGRPIWLSVSVLAAAPRAGDPELAIHLVRDVTETKVMLKRLQDGPATAAPAPNGSPAAELTRRELEVLRLLTEGLNTGRAAQQLHVSRATVRNHIQNLFGKLGVHTRLEAVAHAARHRLF